MSQPGFAGNRRIVDINGDAGAFVNISAVGVVRRLVIEESPVTSAGAANTLQGLLQYGLPNDGTTNGFTTVFEAIGANDVTSQGEIKPAKIELGSPIAQVGPWGEIIGQPSQPIVGVPTADLAPATVMAKLRSGTATATSVVVTEYS